MNDHSHVTSAPPGEEYVYVITEAGSYEVPLSQVPPELMHAVQRKPNPAGIVVKAVVALGLLAAATVTTIVVARRMRRTEPPATGGEGGGTKARVREVVAELGDVATPELVTDEVYADIHPSCPFPLDPEDQSHKGCVDKWLVIYAVALDEVGDPHGDLTPSSGAPTPTVDRLEAFVGDVTDGQLREVRGVVGAQYFDPLMLALENEDEVAAKRAVSRLKGSIDSLGYLQQYGKLQDIRSILGTKTDQLVWIMG